MKYIRYFEEHSAHQVFIDTDLFGRAKLSYCNEEEDVVYRQYKEEPPYLIFTSKQNDSTVKLNRVTTAGTIANLLKYSLDEGETWSNYTFTKQSTNGYSGQTITLQNGESVLFKGTLPQGSFRFVISGKISASGDITYLHSENGGDIALSNSSMYGLFNGCTGLTTAPVLPSTTMPASAYTSMFYGCTSLTTAPELPATTLASSCYRSMFNGCTSLTTAPKLPATTLVDSCYYGMFSGCTSLEEGPYLPATDLKSESYRYMFAGCNSMTKIPDFTVNTLQGSHCLHAMFFDCSNLKDAKVTLNPIRLVPNCYHEMFRNCSSLENGPTVLPATTLADFCYRYMFSGCTSLEIAPDILAINLSGAFPLSYMFLGCSRLRHIKAMFTTTPSSTYTPSWTKGVSPTGVFIKNSSATWNVTGENGIPTGWTVETVSS